MRKCINVLGSISNCCLPRQTRFAPKTSQGASLLIIAEPEPKTTKTTRSMQPILALLSPPPETRWDGVLVPEMSFTPLEIRTISVYFSDISCPCLISSISPELKHLFRLNTPHNIKGQRDIFSSSRALFPNCVHEGGSPGPL